jgi:hypothetical protein
MKFAIHSNLLEQDFYPPLQANLIQLNALFQLPLIGVSEAILFATLGAQLATVFGRPGGDDIARSSW